MGDMSREPSMEEILSSIRRVIARDEAQISAGRAAAPASTPAADALADDADDDVLDLTEAAVPLNGCEATMAAPAEPVADVGPAPSEMLAEPPVENKVAPVSIRAPAAAPVVVDEAAPADPILSPAPQAAARQQLDTLAAALAAAQHSEPRPVDTATTVNALVEASLRPMLRDWLDANLPDIVERIVAREIARISGTGV